MASASWPCRTIRRGSSPILAGPLSLLLEPMGPDTGAIGYGVFGWAHIVIVLGLPHVPPVFASTCTSSCRSPTSISATSARAARCARWTSRRSRPEGEELVFGARTLKDLTWRHLLDPMSCTECGRCMEFCPASMTGKTLSPKHFMEGLRDQIVMTETALAAAAGAQRAAKGGATGGAEASETALQLARERADEALSLPLVDNAIPEEAIWQCTTCGWCVEGCPVLIEHVDSIVEIRRNLVLEESRFPKELNVAFRCMETAGNPWGQPRSARMDWAKGLDVPVLDGADGAASRRRGAVLDRLRRRLRRPQSQGGARHGAASRPGGRAVRGAGGPRELLRAILPGDQATSTSSRCSPRRTSRRSRPPTSHTTCGPWWPAARTASTRSATSIPSSG